MGPVVSSLLKKERKKLKFDQTFSKRAIVVVAVVAVFAVAVVAVVVGAVVFVVVIVVVFAVIVVIIVVVVFLPFYSTEWPQRLSTLVITNAKFFLPT